MPVQLTPFALLGPEPPDDAPSRAMCGDAARFGGAETVRTLAGASRPKLPLESGRAPRTRPPRSESPRLPGTSLGVRTLSRAGRSARRPACSVC